MRATHPAKRQSIAAHAVLLTYTLIALFPVFVIVINSFKSRRAIFAEPLLPPLPGNFDLVGYATVMKQGDFFQYFLNSMTVTCASLFFVLLFGAMAAFALSEYRFRGNMLMGLYLALGIMIPIRLGTGIFKLLQARKPADAKALDSALAKQVAREYRPLFGLASTPPEKHLHFLS